MLLFLALGAHLSLTILTLHVTPLLYDLLATGNIRTPDKILGSVHFPCQAELIQSVELFSGQRFFNFFVR